MLIHIVRFTILLVVFTMFFGITACSPSRNTDTGEEGVASPPSQLSSQAQDETPRSGQPSRELAAAPEATGGATAEPAPPAAVSGDEPAPERVPRGREPGPALQGSSADLLAPSPPREPATAAHAPSDLGAPVIHELDGLTLRRLELARGVEDREPVEPGTSFARGSGRIYVFMQVGNENRREEELQVHWQRVGRPEPQHGHRLSIPARPHWKTFAYIGSNRPAGRYRCIIRTSDGQLLAQAEFEITG